MSETSETKGRCRQQIEAWYANNSSSVPRYSWMVADAIDRLAADVESVMEMTREIALRVPSEFGQDACDVAVRVALKERDAAVRERDQWREEARLAVINRDEARAEAQRLTARLGDRAEVQQTQLSAAFTEGTLQAGDAMRARFEQVEKERDEARAEVERLQEELDDREQTEQIERMREENEILHRASLNYIHDRDQYRRERDQWREEARLAVINRDEARGKVERLRAELAARPAANSSEIPDSSPADPPQAAPAAGWLTEREQHALRHILAADVEPVIRSLLARAGSPPVVGVPPFENYAPEVLHLRYRDAISRAGVKWKEVPRE